MPNEPQVEWDDEAQVFVGHDLMTGIMSQAQTREDALQATREAVQMHNKAIENAKRAKP